MDYFSYEDSIKYGCGELSYIDTVSDEQINYFLNHDNISIDHELIKNCDDPESTVDDLQRILYQINELVKGNKLETIYLCYSRESDFPNFPDIYDGWHRIRAYQYLKYDYIPCIFNKYY
jgi:hypothetical protein